jgi:hypothetical protein
MTESNATPPAVETPNGRIGEVALKLFQDAQLGNPQELIVSDYVTQVPPDDQPEAQSVLELAKQLAILMCPSEEKHEG